MSNRIVERAQGLIGSVIGNNNINQWGGVDVEPASPKIDGQSNDANVPEVGARVQGFNGTTWDRLRSGVSVVVSSFLGFLNTLPYGKFNASGVVLADGEGATLQLDASGRLKTTATTVPSTVGTHANAWNAAAVGVNSVSASIDCQFTPFVSVFGHVSGTTTVITMQLSQDNINFYDAVSTSIAGVSDFEMSREVGARYIRLKSSAIATITATVAGKD